MHAVHWRRLGEVAEGVVSHDAILIVSRLGHQVAIEAVERVGQFLSVRDGLHVPVGQVVHARPLRLALAAAVNLVAGDATVFPPEAHLAVGDDRVAHLDVVFGAQVALVLHREHRRGDDELHRGVVLDGAHDVLILMSRADVGVHPSHGHVLCQVAAPLCHQHTEGLIGLLILVDVIERT